MNPKIKKGATLKEPSGLLVLFLTAISACLMIVKTVHAQSGRIQAIVTPPPGLEPLNSPEVFEPDNLYEKINGQAELYLSAGFVRLKSQWFAEVKNPDSIFEVYIYHMGKGINAFSVYSVQRRGDIQKVDLAQFAYQTKSSLYLVHGPYYLERIAATPSENI